jgi:hypothetical protein
MLEGEPIMINLGLGRIRTGRWLCAFVLATCCTGALAAAASAATLQIRVTPASILEKKSFHVVITGTYSKSELKGKAYLVSFIQYNFKPCKAGAPQEGHAYGKPFAAQNTGASPFGWDFSFTAGGVGERRVCAYLYPKPVGPKSTIAPLTRATITYKVKP